LEIFIQHVPKNHPIVFKALHDINWTVLKEKEVKKMAFNMGLQSAVYVLEKAERLSPRGLRYLKDELKKNIAESDLNLPSNINNIFL